VAAFAEDEDCFLTLNELPRDAADERSTFDAVEMEDGMMGASCSFAPFEAVTADTSFCCCFFFALSSLAAIAQLELTQHQKQMKKKQANE
jgi:hypothetical protein